MMRADGAGLVNLNPNSNLNTGTVLAIASEGQGVLREENGLVVFIPFTALGDRILYQIDRKKKNFAEGSLVEVLEPSPDRTLPQCPYFGVCGGCQLQHLRYEAQLETKRKWLEDALKKIADLKDICIPSIMPAEAQWHYRRRIHLTLKNRQLGYIAIDNRSLIPITHCPIFAKQNDPVIAIIGEICSQLDYTEGKITLLKHSDFDYIAHFHFMSMPKNSAEVFCRDYPGLKGILASSPSKTLRFGELESSFAIDDCTFLFSPQAFVQTHPEQSRNIYKRIEQEAANVRPKEILDLYCGIGVSSILLAKQTARVTGIEVNRHAIRLANVNAKKNGVENVRFISADVETDLKKHLQNLPDFVVVNPPREGLTPSIIEELCHYPAKTLLYISCKPSTLARDLKQLCSKYGVQSVQAFDMFPQTAHLETLVVLKPEMAT